MSTKREGSYKNSYRLMDYVLIATAVFYVLSYRAHILEFFFIAFHRYSRMDGVPVAANAEDCWNKYSPTNYGDPNNIWHNCPCCTIL